MHAYPQHPLSSHRVCLSPLDTLGDLRIYLEGYFPVPMKEWLVPAVVTDALPVCSSPLGYHKEGLFICHIIEVTPAHVWHKAVDHKIFE